MSTFKRESVDVVQASLTLEKADFVKKMQEVYPDQTPGLLTMHYNTNRKKYSFNDKGSIINTETKQLLTQSKTEWVNEDESQEEGEDMPEIVDKPTKKAKKVISEKEVKQPKVKAVEEAKVKAEKPVKEPKPKKEKVEKEKKVSKYALHQKKFSIGDKVAFYAGGIENTGEVTKDFFRNLNGVTTEIIFIKNDDETKNLDKKDKSNIVNAKRVRLIDGEYEVEFKEKKERAKKSTTKAERVLKYADLPLKFVKGENVAFKMRNGEEAIGIVQNSFNRIMKKSNGEVEVFNHLCIDVKGIPNYKKSVYVRAFPDGEYEPIPVKNSGRKAKEVNEEIVVEQTEQENILALDEIERTQELVDATVEQEELVEA